MFRLSLRRSLTALLSSFLLTVVGLSGSPATAAPPSGGSVFASTSVNLGQALVFLGWMSFCNRYERQESVIVISPGKSKVKAFTCDFSTGGAYIPFGVDTTLTLTFDGTPVASTAVKASDTAVTFDVDLTAVNEGWYMASITGGLNGPWSVLDYGIYVLKGATAQPHALMPVTTASHELMFEGGGLYQQAWVPTKFTPVTVPYPSRVFPDLPTMPARKDVVVTSIAVPRPGDLYRPVLSKEGVWTTANRQNYFYYDFEQPKPILPMLDGPRGRGSIIAPVHLEVGNAAPNGALRGNIYFIESWRIGKVTPDGTVVTLAGYRHKDMASYWNDPTSAELVGDWSSIPANRRGFAQPWGMAWDPRTLVINTSAPPIPTEGNEQPHVAGPTLYVSDTYNDRVLKIAYSATAHGVPPKVTEFVTGLNQPWDVIPVGTQLYVSDRMNNAIKVFDMDTGALVKSISVAQPEGMALLDGWLYYASVLTKSIRKINLATGQDVLIADPSIAGSKLGYFINGNSRYMKIAVSDGSFGPRGMIAYTTWSNSYFGYPNLIDGATGNMIDWLHVNNGDVVKGTTPLGLRSYASAVGIGHGRMLFGTAEEGLHIVSKALPTDPVIDATKYKAGMDQWQARGYNLTHGPAGYGYYGLPLPWGQTPEMDYFLAANLHGSSVTGSTPNPSVGVSPSSAAFGNVTVGQTSAPQTIVVTNTGATATDMVYPATPARFNRSGTCSGATLNAGTSCTLVFTYTPTATATDNATYTVIGGGSTMPISLSGTGVSGSAASLSASPTSLSFGSVTVGQSSGAASVTVTNAGGAAANGLSIANGNATEFVVSGNTCGSSLAAGASCGLNVIYKPTTGGADNANLTFSFSGGSSVQVAMSGTGTAPSGSHPVDTLAPMTWFEVPNSAVSTSGEMYQYPAGTFFGSSPSIRFFDESGASYDSLRNRMVVFGGGHNDYAGNEIMVFDIDTLRWSRVNDPSPRLDPTGLVERSGYYPDANGNPDLQQPRSRHSYWSQIHVPTIDRYCAISAFGTYPNGLGASHVDCFDFATKLWSQKQDAPNAGGLLTSTFDPSTNRVWVMGNRVEGAGYLAEWDAATDAWTRRSTSPSGVNDRSAPLLDTKRRRLVFLGGGQVRMFDLNQSGMLVSQLIAIQGDVEIINRDRPGFAYDPVNDKYVAYSGVESGGTRDIYVIDPVTWTSTRTTLGGAVAPAVPASVDTGGWFNGIYGRLAYIPTKNAFIFINNHVRDTVFFFKLSSAAGPPGPAGATVSASPTSLAFGNITVGQTSASQTITVSNTGSGAATNMVYPAAPARFNRSGTCSGTTLNAGTSCTIVFTYTPVTAATDNSTYTVTGGGSTMLISLSGTGVSAASAALSASSTLLSFGSVTVGKASTGQSVTVTNTGGAAANGLSISNGNAAEFVVSGNTCGSSLAAGASCGLTVSYAPKDVGADNTSIVFTLAGASIQVAMKGTGAAGAAPSLSAMPSTVSFGRVTVGTLSAAQSVIVTNTGSAPVTSIGVLNSNAARFPLTANKCGTTLDSGASCTLIIAYSPNADTADSGVITIGSSVGSVAISLSGTGTGSPSASLSAAPPLVSFGNVTLGQTSAPVRITITNIGGAAAAGLSLAIGNGAEFLLSGNTCGTTLGAGASCGLSVAYKPKATGAESAVLTWNYNGGGSLSVSLSGTSTGGGVLSMPATVTLLGQQAGTVGAPQVVTIKNTGTGPVMVTSITSSNAGEFPITGSNCASLSTGASCTFSVTFAPFAAGARSAAISVASNGAQGPQSIKAVGTGMAGILAPPPPPGAAAAIEYYHAEFDHYFITAIADEIAKLDSGTFIGWVRTGKQFNVHPAPATSSNAACRFFSTAFGVKSSHFYSSDAAECATVKLNPDWQFEGEVFYAKAPLPDGSCPAGERPVYRVYNNGQGDAPNHRYTIDQSIRALMLAQGGIAEGYGTLGVIMCVPN